MKHLIGKLFFLLTPISCLCGAEGEIVFEKRDHYVVDTGTGYTVLQWHEGCMLEEGDRIDGSLHSSGFKQVYNISSQGETRVYIQGTCLSKDDVMERIFELED